MKRLGNTTSLSRGALWKTSPNLEQLLVVWTDGSRNEDARVGAAAVYKHNDKWHTLRWHLGTNKESFDAQLYALGMALKEIRSKAGGWEYTEVELRCDAQAALKRIKE